MDEEKLSTLRLMRSENLGVRTFFSLIKFCGNAVNALNKVHEIASYRGKQIKLCSKEDALLEYEKTLAYAADMLFFHENEYPQLLKEADDYPPILIVRGKNKDLLSKAKIAIVGSRNSSLNGNRFAHKITKDIGAKGYTVVSGLARGVDTAVHKASLEFGTIGVIAGGIDNIYPLENKSLYAEIQESGLIVTENAFGCSPKPMNFPQRNRIISGLSLATIVVEASLKSGSLITARFALEQNREVFAVPGFPMDPRYSGTNKLIKQGAHLLESAEDITSVLEDVVLSRSKSIDKGPLFEKDETFMQEEVGNVSSDLDKIEKLVLSSLSTTPIEIDFLIRTLKVPASLLMLSIIELELLGKIQRVNNSICTAA